MAKPVEHPIILGIVGDSASGKTTLSAGVAQILGEAHCTVICTDDYHRYDRAQRAAAGLSALHPRSRLCGCRVRARPALEYSRGPGPAFAPAAWRRADPEAGLRSSPGDVSAARICAAEGLRHRRRPAWLHHARHARLLRREDLSRSRGGAEKAVEAPSRYGAAWLYAGAGAVSARAAPSAEPDLHPSTAHLCRHRHPLSAIQGRKWLRHPARCPPYPAADAAPSRFHAFIRWLEQCRAAPL